MGESKTKIIALSGKGGVGKTSLSAAMVRILTEKYPGARILAIDADPAVGLATALKADVSQSIDDIRLEIISSVEENDGRTTLELLEEARYRIFDIMTEQHGFYFLAVGRPEGAGCYCKINSFLKDVITLISGEFNFVVIDGEAGIEQINRRVMEKVTHLFLCTDQSKKGCQVAQTIASVAKRLVMYEEMYAIVNRITSEKIKEYPHLGSISVCAWVRNDESLVEMDIEGRDIFSLPKESFLIKGAETALETAGVFRNPSADIR